MSDGTNEALSNSDELDSGTSSDQASDHESSDNDDGPADSVENEQDEIDYSQHPLHKLLHKMAKDKPQISQDDLDELGTLLGQEDTQVDLPNSNNETALHVAAEAGLVEAARMLIDAGASLTERDDDKRQPLHLACREGHTEMARLLLEKGADIEAVQYQQATALDDAAHWDHLEVVEMLLDWGANSQVVCHDDCSLLHRATYQGHDKIVRALLQDSKANLDAPEGVDGLTALHYAIWNENMEILSILLDNGARLDVQDKDGWTPLMTATRRFPECIPILLGQKEFNGQLEIPDNESYTPLLEASKNAELETVRLLINAGADCNARDKCGRTALHLAIKRGLPSIVSVLLEDSKVNINAQSNDLKNTPLHLASGVRPISENETDPVSVPDELIIYEYEYEEGQYGTIVQYLLERKADPRATNKNGETALHYAAASGDPSRLESIMNVLNKEDMTTQNGKGWTALHSALKGKDPIAALSSLLHSGKFDTADFGDDNQMWEEAVKWASGDFRSHDVARLLLKYRPEVPRSLLSNNWSAIEWAAHDQMPEVLGRLVDTSRNNDETDKALESALTLMLTSISISSRNTVNERSAMVLSLLMSNSPRPNEERLQSALASVLGLIERPDDEKICEQLPRLLWLLITANHRGPDMDDRLEKTLKVVRSHKVPTKRDGPEISQAKPRVIPPQPRTKKGSNKDQWRKQVMEKDKQQPEIKPDDRKGFRMEDLEAIEVILQDPPFAQVFEDSKRYELPKLNEGLSDKLSGFMADIVQFYKSQGKSGTIRRKRPVQEVIYDAGPKRIMATTIRSLYGIIGKDSGLPGHTMDTEAGPHFTWVHLPSTNVGTITSQNEKDIANIE
ncbi:hypothetical protein NW766_001765 [Fusarium irregulare]|uniref:Ankyrin repeat protein n=1 Tax=Fusarium irregulare TaxID=2494466 RepID=A0A9W8PZ90_9HYPO|nr:hypothetical protein NW766_001765 [Fusarium irregulare]